MQVRTTAIALVLLAAAAHAGAQGAFTATALPDSVFERMKGKSYPEDCAIPRSQLRYLRVLHVDAEGKTHTGELVCHADIAEDLLCIFHQLYDAGYPIERIRLIDDYDADDERSMQDNNTSCFCHRPVTNGRTLSKHATGMAIDINPRYNPYLPANGDTLPANAQHSGPYRIEPGDLCHRLFTEHGFSWGGTWRRTKDFQHFQR